MISHVELLSSNEIGFLQNIYNEDESHEWNYLRCNAEQ